jgi:hypothetical protein
VKKGIILGRINSHKIFADRDFYPVLFGQRSYGNILSLAADRIIAKR